MIKCNPRIAALSTMFLMVNVFIALSLGVHLEQFEQRMGLTCPRPFLLRPLSIQCQLIIFSLDVRNSEGHSYLDARFLTIFSGLKWSVVFSGAQSSGILTLSNGR